MPTSPLPGNDIAPAQKEARYRVLAEALPQLVWTADADGRVDYYNQRASEYAIERDADSGWRWESFVHPEDLARTGEQWSAAMRNGTAYGSEHRLRMRNGLWRWHVSRALPVRDERGHITGWAGTATDIHTEKLRANSDRFRAALSDALRPLTDAHTIQQQACMLLGEHLGAGRTMYTSVDEATGTGTITVDHVHGMARMAGTIALNDFGSGIVETLRAGRPLIMDDVANDTRLSDAERAAYKAADIGAALAVALVRQGRLEAILSLHADRSRTWAPEEVALVEEVGERTWAALERGRAEVARQQAQERYQVFLNHSGEGIWRCELDEPLPVDTPLAAMLDHAYAHAYLAECNDAMARMYGLQSGKELEGARLADLMPRTPANEAYLTAFFQNDFRLMGGESVEVHQDGHTIHMSNNLVGIVEGDHLVRVWGTQTDISQNRKAEIELRTSESFNRSLMDASPDCVKVLDLQGHLLMMNPPGMCVMEIDDFAPFKGKAWCGLWPEEAQAQVNLAVARARAGEESAFEAFCPTAKGTPKWWDVRVQPVREGTDGPIVRILSISRDITDQRENAMALQRELTASKQLADRLHDSESRFRSLADSMAQLAWIAGADGKPFWWNKRWDTFAGRPMVDMTPEERTAMSHPGHLDRARNNYYDAVQRGQDWEDTYPMRGASGAWRWFLARATPVRTPEGVVSLWFGTATDITELREAQERARRAEEAADMGVWETDLRTQQTYFSPGFRALYGLDPVRPYTMEEAYHVIHPDDVEPVRATFARAVEQREEHWNSTNRFIHPLTGLRWQFGRSRIEYDEAGTPIRVAGTSVDITDLRAAEEALRESESRFRMATATGRVGVWEWHIPTNSVTWSDVLYDIQGVEPGTFNGTVEAFTALVHPEDRALVGTTIQRALEEDAPYEMEFRAQRPSDGRTIWLHTRARVLRDAQDRPERLVGAVVDMTRQKADEAALKQADRRKSDFLATLAHELRNPLSPLRNGVAALQSGVSDEDGKRTLEVMERQVGHLSRLMDDLLDLSRIDRGIIVLRTSPIDLLDVLRSVVDAMRPVMVSSGHRFEAALPERAIPVQGDATRLAQVFGNLLQNAAKYTPRGGHVHLSVERTAAAVRVLINDTGVGLKAEDMDRIFDLFAQADERRDRALGGLGIGLNLARRLTEKHGGELSARSEGPGKGSTFTVALPLTAQQATGSTQPKPMRAETTTAPIDILVVDDNADGVMLMAMLLKRMGHRVRTAASGQEGLDVGAAHPPQLVLMDIGMPEMDGYEACRRMRRTEWGGQAYICALTGWGMQEDRDRSAAAGFDEHFVKPVPSDDLHRAIASAHVRAHQG